MFEDQSGLNDSRANDLNRQSLQDPLINAVAGRHIRDYGETPEEALENTRREVRNYRRNQKKPHTSHLL